MKVLLVTRPGVGGAARHVLDLVTGLSGEHEIKALASPLEDPTFLDRLADAGATVEAVPMRRGPHFRSDVSAVRSVRRAVREFRPDVIHAHAFKAGAVARLGARGAPVVYSPHGFYHLYPTAPAPARKVARMVERRLAKRTAVLALCAEWEREVVTVDGLDRGAVVTVIPNGVESPERPALSEIRDHKVEPNWAAIGRPMLVRHSLGLGPLQDMVLMAGRLAPPKDPRCFVDAALAAPDDIGFVLVGDGPELEEYRALATERENLFVLGYRKDLPELLDAAGIAVLATRFEATPYFLLQAMESGCACVATDLPSTREVLGDTGILIPPDPEALLQAVRELVDDQERKCALAVAARERVREHYSMERMLAAIRDAWETTAGSGVVGA